MKKTKDPNDANLTLNLIDVTDTLVDLSKFRVDVEKSFKNSNVFTPFEKSVIRETFNARTKELLKERALKEKTLSIGGLENVNNNSLMGYQQFRTRIWRMAEKYSLKFIHQVLNDFEIRKSKTTLSKRISATPERKYVDIINTINKGPDLTSRHPH